MKNRKSFNSVRFEKGSGKNYVVKSVLSKGNADFFVEVYKMTILETKNLKKYYGKGDTQVKALDGVNLSVEDGEFVAIVGTSGSGKSTLLHMLGGLDRPTSGSVTVDGKNIFSLKDEALTIFRRRKIGFVFQSFNLVPVLTVRENIVLPIQLDGGKVDERYVEVTALVPYRFITKVHKGMSADIEFEGYASSEYGLLKAEIEGLEDSIVTVSGDNFFSTKLIIEKKDIELYHLQVKMKGTASILLSKRSLIDMFS